MPPSVRHPRKVPRKAFCKAQAKRVARGGKGTQLAGKHCQTKGPRR